MFLIVECVSHAISPAKHRLLIAENLFNYYDAAYTGPTGAFEETDRRMFINEMLNAFMQGPNFETFLKTAVSRIDADKYLFMYLPSNIVESAEKVRFGLLTLYLCIGLVCLVSFCCTILILVTAMQVKNCEKN